MAGLLLGPRDSWGFGINLMGQMSEPLIGAAKDKAQGMLRFLWLQPYGGYAFGKGTLTDLGAGAAVNYTSGISYEGLFYGARGGFGVPNMFRLGVDYTEQFAQRKERAVNAAGLLISSKTKSNNKVMGIHLGFNLPSYPIHGSVTRYFSAKMHGGSVTTGEGWGTGISFALSGPFICLAEYRWFDFSSEVGAQQQQQLRTMKQYYLGLSFLLL